MLLKIIEFFTDEFLSQWAELFAKCDKKLYNLNSIWCFEYWKNFCQNKNQKLHLICIFRGKELVAVLPMILERNKLLVALGSNPKIYDAFSVLSFESKATELIADYLVKSKYKIHFDLLNSEDDFTKLLLLEFLKNKIKIDTEIRALKPYSENIINFDGQFQIDTNRQINKIKTDISNDLICTKTNKPEDLELFKKWYIEKYPKGLFKKDNFNNFLNNLFKNEIYELYQLQAGEKILSYILIAKNDENNVTMLMTSSNFEYFKYSSGRILIYVYLKDFFAKNDESKIFDFGTGHEYYKYQFSNKDNLMINISTFKIMWIIKLIRKFVRFF